MALDSKLRNALAECIARPIDSQVKIISNSTGFGPSRRKAIVK